MARTSDLMMRPRLLSSWVSSRVRSRSVSRFVIVAIVAMLVAGCRLGVGATAEVEPDLTGRVVAQFSLDAVMVRHLDEFEVDPTASLAAGAIGTEWLVDRRTDADGSLVVTLIREVEHPGGVADALRELSAGADDAAPALVIDLVIDQDDLGVVVVSGHAQLRPPRDVGLLIDGVPVGPSSQELSALTADVVDAHFSLELPGVVTDDDGDMLDGSTVRWELPVGELRTIHAVAEPQAVSERDLWRQVAWWLAATVVVAAALVATRSWRRRRDIARD